MASTRRASRKRDPSVLIEPRSRGAAPRHEGIRGRRLAAAVLIDATIVRGVLLPASMKLLGDRNWYLPKWLHWLPTLEHNTDPGLAPAPAAA